MDNDQTLSPRRRLQTLLAIPDSQRTEAQWDEIVELEITLAPGNRENGPGRDMRMAPSQPPRKQQQQQQHNKPNKPNNKPPEAAAANKGGGNKPNRNKPRGGRPNKPKAATPES
jgi:hypothetical protein